MIKAQAKDWKYTTVVFRLASVVCLAAVVFWACKLQQLVEKTKVDFMTRQITIEFHERRQ